MIRIGAAGFAAIAAGAVLGAWLRFALGALLNRSIESLPLGTLVANLLGGLLVGAAIAWLSRHPELSPLWRLFLVTGFMGALTTFSTFSAESLELIQRGDVGWAFAHAGLHLFGSLAAAAIGFRLAS
ncbi:fluoride efflux transporter CrcB [Quisquiliibacterium transsilvanicum]|uniref:Fluoride-specific ion channel FluC n=1 Tax=Quisquiliibacterium transsilvanicum TaxID=1549638 RepID=A0A7W8M7X3_9BURK|nr:CrcB protein [Quisquiliibacterium transsilvanicum]